MDPFSAKILFPQSPTAVPGGTSQNSNKNNPNISLALGSISQSQTQSALSIQGRLLLGPPQAEMSRATAASEEKRKITRDVGTKILEISKRTSLQRRPSFEPIPQSNLASLQGHYKYCRNIGFPIFKAIETFIYNPTQFNFSEYYKLEDYLGIKGHSQKLMSPILFGVIHFSSISRGDLIPSFLSKMLAKFHEFGVPCLDEYEGIHIYNLLVHLKEEKALKVLDSHFNMANQSASFFKEEFASIDQEWNRSESVSRDQESNEAELNTYARRLKQSFWNLFKSENISPSDLHDSCEKLRELGKVDPCLCIQMQHIIPVMQHNLIFESRMELQDKLRYIELLVNLKESLIVQQKMIIYKKFSPNFFETAEPKLITERYLQFCLLAYKEPAYSSYLVKMLQGWASNLSYINNRALSVTHPLLSCFCKIKDGQMKLSAEESKEMAQKLVLYKGASLGFTSRSFLEYCAAKFQGAFVDLLVNFNKEEASPYVNTIIPAPISSTASSKEKPSLTDRIQNVSPPLMMRPPSIQTIKPVAVNPSKNDELLSALFGSESEEEKFTSWDIVYKSAADAFLKLLNKEEFLFAVTQVLEGKSPKLSTKLVEEIKQNMLEVQQEFTQQQNIDLQAAEEALLYFFETEIPAPCLQLLDLKSIPGFSIITGETTHNFQANKVVIEAYLQQLTKLIEWKKAHLSAVHEKKFESKEYLTLIVSKTVRGGIEVHPAFFEFNRTMALKSFRVDHDKASVLLSKIFVGDIKIIDGKVNLSERQFSTFYKRLKKDGPYYNVSGQPAEFLLIPKGKIIEEQIEGVEEAAEPKQRDKPKIPVVWSTPSLATVDAFYSENPFVRLWRDQLIKVCDRIERQMRRSEILGKLDKFGKISTEISKFVETLSNEWQDIHLFSVPGLMDYQKMAVNFLLKLHSQGFLGGLLALDTGLGKTITTLAVILELSKIKAYAPSFVTCTKSTEIQTVDSYRKNTAEVILLELEGIAEEIKTTKNFDRLKDNFIRLKQFPMSLERELQKLKAQSPRKKDNQIYHQSQIKFIEGLLARAKVILQSVEERTKGLSNVIPKEYQDEFLAKPSSDYWNFDIFNDIVDGRTWAKMPAIPNQRKIVILTQELLAKTKERIINSYPLSIIVDEAQSISNVETQCYQTLDTVLSALKQQGKPAFVVMASATLFMHNVDNLLAYLKCLTPMTLTHADPGVISISDLALMIPNAFKDMANQFYQICTSEKIVEEEKLLELYAKLKKNFALLEAFKQFLNTVTISMKKTDEGIRQQWNNRIPIAEYVTHPFNLSNQQKQPLKVVEDTFKGTNKETQGNFFSYHSNVYKVLFHPDLYLRANDEGFIAELKAKTLEELIEWGKASPLINYFLTDPAFEAHARKGALIFVEETWKGNILKICFKKKFGKKFPYLKGDVSALRRKTMAQRFEGAQDGELNIMIANTIAAQAGVDLPMKGLHVYFCFRDFNPKGQEQGANRLIRVNSDKEVVYVHNFSFPEVSLQEVLLWHEKKKLVTEAFYFAQLQPNFSNASTLFRDMMKLIPFGISYSHYNQQLASDIEKLSNTMLQFLRDDREFTQNLSIIAPVSRDKGKDKVVVRDKKRCRPNEKGKEKLPIRKKQKGESAPLPEKEVEPSIKRKREPEAKVDEVANKRQKETPAFAPGALADMQKYLASFDGARGLDIQHSRFVFHGTSRPLHFDVIPMRKADPQRSDNFARTVFAGERLLMDPNASAALLKELDTVRATDFYLTARASSTLLGIGYPQIAPCLWDQLQSPYTQEVKDKQTWNALVRRLRIEIYTPDGKCSIYVPGEVPTEENLSEETKPVIRLLQLGCHFDLLHLTN